jgi:hypothetical protein
MTTPATGKAFAVLFDVFYRWDPPSFYPITWHWPQSVLRPIGSFLIPRKEKVDTKRFAFADLQPFTIHLDGAVDRREVEAGKEYSMDLFFARPGDIVVAKIDLKNGAVGIVPNWKNVVVTNHFAVYQPNLDIIVPQYFHLLVQTNLFKAHLWRNKVGAEGRKEVKLDFFEAQKIPVPRRDIQQAIVDHWQNAQDGVDAAREGLSWPVRSLNSRLMDAYRKTCTRDVIHSRFFVLEFKDLAAWDAKSGRAASFRLACPSFRPMGDFIEEATELIRPAAEPNKDWPVYGVNNRDGVFLNSHQKGAAFNSPYKRIRKDWFFHNPTRCNVGSLGIVPDVPEDAITSPEYQVWRLKTGVPEPMLPDYVACLIQTPFFLDLVQFNRVGAVKQRMYTENLMQVHIPYLPVQEQQHYTNARERALTALTAAKQRLDVARREVEAMILGAKRVGAL